MPASNSNASTLSSYLEETLGIELVIPSTPDDPLPRSPSATPVAGGNELTRQTIAAQRAFDEASLAASARRGANWFYWVAALSMVNSIIALSGGNLTFLAGLAIPQIADAFAANLGMVGPYFSLGTDLVIAFFFCGFGYLTTHGSRAAFVVGIILYALDGGIFLYFSDYLPALFHAYALYNMWAGWKARQKLARLRAEPPLAGIGM